MRASTGGHKRIGEFLLNCGADVDDEDCVSGRSGTVLFRSNDSTITVFQFQYTTLMRAAIGGHLEVVKTLLDRGCNVNKSDLVS